MFLILIIYLQCFEFYFYFPPRLSIIIWSLIRLIVDSNSLNPQHPKYNSIDLNQHDSGNVDSNQVSLSDDTSTNSQITSPILRVQSLTHHNPSVSPPLQTHQKSSSSASYGSFSSIYDRQTATSAATAASARSLYKHFNKSSSNNNNISDLNSPNAPSQIDYYNSYNSLSRPAANGGRDSAIEYSGNSWRKL
ncbi:MAG: hypothetical protein MHMPM18_003810 [Marteilia pararefringens]